MDQLTKNNLNTLVRHRLNIWMLSSKGMKSTLTLLLLLCIALAGCDSSAAFEEQTFLDNGPHQQGTIAIDRSKLQTVVTWCSPTLLKMAVYDSVNESYPMHYKQLRGEDHPLQVSVTVFPPKLPFAYATDYSKPTHATSICSPASIDTSLSTTTRQSTELQHPLGAAFEVKSDEMSVVAVNCDTGKAGLMATGNYPGPHYGQVGGTASIPAGESAKVTGECQTNSFSIQIN